MEPRLRALGFEVEYVGRDASASPATGSPQVHVREQKDLVAAALSGKIPHLVRATPSPAFRRITSAEAGDGEKEPADQAQDVQEVG
jgi:2-oxoglutarate dehydrogenase E1 component